MFSLYEYTWVTPGKAWLQIGTFVAVFLSVCYVSKLTYQDRVSYPREFEGGLEKELGGRGAVRVSFCARPVLLQQSCHANISGQARMAGDPDP